jgi:hypothetical protein
MMVEKVVEGIPRVMKLLEVEKPTRFFVDRPADGELYAKAVAMKAGALVTHGHSRKSVRCFEAKLVCEADVHGKGQIFYVHRPLKEAAQGQSNEEQALPCQAQGKGSRAP